MDYAMTNKHVHYDLILQWANGVKIQKYCNGKWITLTHPIWDKNSCYRVEPEPVIDIAYVAIDTGWNTSEAYNDIKYAKESEKLSKDVDCVLKITRTDGVTTSVEIIT